MWGPVLALGAAKDRRITAILDNRFIVRGSAAAIDALDTWQWLARMPSNGSAARWNCIHSYVPHRNDRQLHEYPRSSQPHRRGTSNRITAIQSIRNKDTPACLQWMQVIYAVIASAPELTESRIILQGERCSSARAPSQSNLLIEMVGVTGFEPATYTSRT